VRILGKPYSVKAKVAQIHGFSAHADQDDLFRWLLAMRRSPKHLFVTHGEPEAADIFSDLVRDKTKWSVSVPEYKAEIILD